MRRHFGVILLALAIFLHGLLVHAADFYVIPSQVQHYAPVERTGQTLCYKVDGTEGQIVCQSSHQDGESQKGVAWPSPRFIDNGNGTVTDHLTKLVWFKDATAIGSCSWGYALYVCSLLKDNGTSLTDGSQAGDWRLPNAKELESLIDFAHSNPALSNSDGTDKWTQGNAFDNVFSVQYWSSTTVANSTSSAWRVFLYNGRVSDDIKTNLNYVWPVRGGQ